MGKTRAGRFALRGQRTALLHLETMTQAVDSADSVDPRALEALNRYFGYDSFRPGQSGIVSAILTGHDVLGVMPTGAGKSICYQIPAAILPGVAIVISPLISLMRDQVDALNDVGLPAAFHQHHSDAGRTGSRLRAGALRPDQTAVRGAGTFGNRTIPQLRRPCADLARRRRRSALRLPMGAGLPFLILASANSSPDCPHVQRSPRSPPPPPNACAATSFRFWACTHRPSPSPVSTGRTCISTSSACHAKNSKHPGWRPSIASHPDESGIVDCATRKETEALAESLNSAVTELRAAGGADVSDIGTIAVAYHGGMSADAREKAQRDFVTDRVPVVVATNAFGMGIDKSNVRFVIHHNMPESIEAYCQGGGMAPDETANQAALHAVVEQQSGHRT